MTWTWLLKQTVLALHSESISAYGGGLGIRDEGLLESALARPQNLAAYGEPTPFALAAAYAYGIVRNHPFIDGNRRTGLLAAYVFLWRNGWRLTAPEAEAVVAILELAAGKMTKAALAEWFEKNSTELR